MRCREVEILWDDIRGSCTKSMREAVMAHLNTCPPCQELFSQYEGVAYCLSCLPQPEPSCDLAQRVIAHLAALRGPDATPLVLAALVTPVGRLYVGFKGERIAFVGIDTGEPLEDLRSRLERRLHRPVVAGDPPGWLIRTIDRYFTTWRVDEGQVDLSDLTPFAQAALRAAARIPPGEVRSYAWVAMQIGKPKAARAVGQVMARNPLPLLFPCHRVVDASGDLHNYGYGLEMKARLLQMEGYRAPR
ncbi:MAG TPA: methylated-DNA--[protein]-cysteine S-methyltransferase [Candidatus Baltobacteraceae bacterium]